LAEWSKASRLGRDIFGCKSSNLLAHKLFFCFSYMQTTWTSTWTWLAMKEMVVVLANKVSYSGCC
jgi:hypothetical protein